jgi:hypothetical protein
MRARKAGRGARLGIVLAAMLVIMSMGAGQAFAAGKLISIDTPVATSGLTAYLSGTADSPVNASHHLEIGWGDSSTSVVPLPGFTGPWSWGPVAHTYAVAGRYRVVAILTIEDADRHIRTTDVASVLVTIGEGA